MTKNQNFYEIGPIDHWKAYYLCNTEDEPVKMLPFKK